MTEWILGIIPGFFISPSGPVPIVVYFGKGLWFRNTVTSTNKQVHSVTPVGFQYKLRASILTQNLPQEGQLITFDFWLCLGILYL